MRSPQEGHLLAVDATNRRSAEKPEGTKTVSVHLKEGRERGGIPHSRLLVERSISLFPSLHC